MSQKNRRGTRISTTRDPEGQGVQENFEHIEEQEYALFPSAEFLKQLNELNPDYVTQILEDYRVEKSHRHQLERGQFEEAKRLNTEMIAMDNRQLDLVSRGQWFGLVLGLGLIVLAGIGVYHHETVVATTSVTAILGILIVYVLRKVPTRKE